MKFLNSALALALATTTPARADELGDILKTLEDNYAKLAGYESTYEVQTSDGKTGNISIAVDFQSGWSSLISELKDKSGNIVQKGEQWTTPDGLYLLQSGDQLAVFEGFAALGERFDNLAKTLSQGQEVNPSRVRPFFYLETNEIQMGIEHSIGILGMISKAEKLLEKNEKTVRLELADLGQIEVEIQSGLIVSQVLKTKDQARSFKRLTYKAHPAKETIAKKLTINLEGVPRRNLSETGMGHEIIRKSLQTIINRAGTNKDFFNRLQDYLEAIEDQFVTFLSAEALNRAGFIKNDFLFSVLDQATARTTQKLRENGQRATAAELLTTPQSRENLIRAMTALFRQKAPPQKKQQYLDEVLHGKLTGKEGDSLAARLLVEDFIERAYYRVRIGRGIDAYLKSLQGK